MSCCGKQILQTGQKAGEIVTGNLLLLADSIGLLPEKTCQNAQERLAICRQCENGTWLTWSEYWTWVERNGGKLKFVAEVSNLTPWPLLPKQKEYKSGHKLFCRICKCWLPAKSYVSQEDCPAGHWPKI